MTQLWIGYARTGREFEVRDAIRALGADADVPRKVEAVRVGKKRWPEPRVSPILPNYVFVTCEIDQWHAVHGVRYLAPTMVIASRAAAIQIAAFVAATEAEYADRMARIEAGQRLEEFADGDPISIAGPLGATLATFRALVEHPGSEYPAIRAEIEMMGRSVAIEADPLMVRLVK